MSETKFTPEFIEEQRTLMTDAGLPWRVHNRPPQMDRNSTAQIIASPQTPRMIADRLSPDDAEYAVDAANNYPAALDEIERLRARVAELEAADRWIPVSERLPKNNQYVLASERIWWGPRYASYWYHSDLRDSFMRDFTHWRPLPQPPQEGAK